MRPIVCRWDWKEGVLRPLRGIMTDIAAAQFTDGAVYHVLFQEDRDMVSHRHYFAALRDIYDSMPDEYFMDFPTVEHMRKRALIETGWCETKDVVCADEKEAAELSDVIRWTAGEEYCVTVLRGRSVRIFKARSQSLKAMGKKDFQKSKQDVLDWCEGLLQKEKTA